MKIRIRKGKLLFIINNNKNVYVKMIFLLIRYFIIKFFNKKIINMDKLKNKNVIYA